jgi:hypothetical protein
MKQAPAFLLALAMIVSHRVGRASPVAEEQHRLASESFRQAQAAFGRRQYAAAAAAFEQAAKFEAHPSPLLDAEEAWELAGEPVRAAEDCDLVLALPGVEGRFVVEAERRLKALSTKIATLEVRGPRTSAVRFDGGVDVVLPTRRRLSPGRHELALVDLRSATLRTVPLELAPGEVRTWDAGDGDSDSSSTERPVAGPQPSAQSTPVATSDPSASSPAHTRRVPLASWIALGASAVAAGVAIGFGSATLTAKRDYAVIPAQSTADAFERDKTVTNAAWGTALVAAAAAVIIWRVTPDTSTVYSSR